MRPNRVKESDGVCVCVSAIEWKRNANNESDREMNPIQDQQPYAIIIAATRFIFIMIRDSRSQFMNRHKFHKDPSRDKSFKEIISRHRVRVAANYFRFVK